MDKMVPRVDNIAHYLGQFAPVQISDEPGAWGLFAVAPFLAVVVIAIGLGLTTVWVVFLGHVLITLIVLAT